MPDQMIPTPTVRAKPYRHVLPAGTELWRVHSAHRAATEFKPVPADLHWGGGRFCDIRDGLSTGPLPYLYAGLSPLTALCETLARDLRMRPDGRRRITQPRVRDMVLSKVATATDLPLVDLTDNARLAAVHQDIWLVQAPAPDYPRTRRWGSWIRDQAEHYGKLVSNYRAVGEALGMPVGSIGPTRMRCLDTLRSLVGDSGYSFDARRRS